MKAEALKEFLKKNNNTIENFFESSDDFNEVTTTSNFFIDGYEEFFDNIKKVIKHDVSEISDIAFVNDGLTNRSFRFKVEDKYYIYRHPGVGTDEYIHREGEAFAEKIAAKYGLDDTFIFVDPVEGWKVSYYIMDSHTLDYNNETEVTTALQAIKRFHDLQIKGDFDFGIWERALEFHGKINHLGEQQFNDYYELNEKMKRVYELVESDGVEAVLCHCDFYDPNILFKDGRMYLIDWEYAGNDDPACDLGTFIACSEYSLDDANRIFDIYEGETMSDERRRHFFGYVALSSYYWFEWAIFQESNGSMVGHYLKLWYDYSHKYANHTLELYGDR